MEITATTNSSSWELSPTNAATGAVLGVLFIYLLFRHFMFVLMFMDIVLGWLRGFRWFPKEGKRRKTLFHWLGAIALFAGFLAIAGPMGWLTVTPY